MSTDQTATERQIRITVDDFKARLNSGEPVTVLDSRGEQAWQSSPVKIQGAHRWPADLPGHASWPKNRLTVAYCT